MTPVVVLVIVALLVGFLCGLGAISARGCSPGRREAQTPSQRPAGGKKRRDCYYLSDVRLVPTVSGWPGYAISLKDSSLGHTAIVAFLNSLPTITSAKAITLTGNPGVSELTDAEKAIATDKGWTLTL